MFAVEALQGGNRVGTDRNTKFTKVTTGNFHFKIGDASGSFEKTWSGEAASTGAWDEGGDGNIKIFNSADGKSIKKGTYVLEFTPKWTKFDATKYPGVKDVMIRVDSWSKIDKLESITMAQSVDILTGSKVEFVK